MKQNPNDQQSSSGVQELFLSELLNDASVLHLLPCAVYVCDRSGLIVSYNKKAAELWGRSPHPAEADRFSGVFKLYKVNGEPIALDQSPMALCLTDGTPIIDQDIFLEMPDLSRIAIRENIVPVKDEQGNVQGAISYFYSVTQSEKTDGDPTLSNNTDIRRAELALRESETKYRELAAQLEERVREKTADLARKNDELKRSEERYHKMVDEVEDYAIIMLDPGGIIQNWNRGAEKIKGYREQEIVGKSVTSFYLPEDRQSGLPQRLLNQAKQEGKAIHEGWRMRKDGSRFWGSIVLTALHDGENNLIGFTKVTRDLTERKLAEDRLAEYSKQLEFQNQELEQFAYAASHDLKEPLRKIHMYNSCVADDTANQLTEKSRNYLQRSLRAVKRMAELIEDLLAYSKMTGSAEGHEPVDLGEVVAEVIANNKDDFEQKRVNLKFKSLPIVHGVPFQLRQLLENLIGNAVKYKHADRDPVIQISSQMVSGSEIEQEDIETKSQYYKISILDNGIGFDAQYAEKVFDIFHRLNNTAGVSGSGIGLAICKRIVQNHKGVIKAKSKVNEGAQFDIYLPA